MIAARRLGACLVFIVLVTLAALATLWNLQTARGLSNSYHGLPVDPAAEFRALRSGIIDGGLEAVEAKRARFMRLAARDPLGDEAFLLTGLSSREAGRFREALNHFEQARARDPRNSITRVLLAESYFLEARGGDVVAQAAALQRLHEGAAGAFLPLVAELVRNPSTRSETIESLGDERLAPLVMRNLAKDGVSPDLLMDFGFAPMADGSINEKEADLIFSLVQPYVSAGSWTDATQLWSHYYGLDNLSLRVVTDPRFKGSPGPPFGWTLGQSTGGFAEFSENGLKAVHYGRSQWTIARQIIRLVPGPHGLSYSLAGSGVPSGFAWRIQCMPGGQVLLDAPFVYEGPFARAPSGRFEVPAGECEAQSIILTGLAKNRAETREMTLVSVEITSGSVE